ncbi:uncharacterized protein LOC131289398 [Anopheles ziemanni]|uniref:uncharacterized protein LOC131272426 n=1 Tax=Anopheles coustani TaxID=139045 RepID=UPI002659B96B|nr:uncharacterized protein LOC131272426 [Anopheles coustani]XP_058174629.1 uncharacterized protein LOC131289398 [Anopheles ziemanni]
MASEISFKEKVAKYRRQLGSSSVPEMLLRTLKEMECYVDGFPDDSNRQICAAHLGKELVDWISQKQDDVLQMELGQSLFVVLERFLAICHKAQSAIRCFCVARLYNAGIALNTKNTSQRLRLRVCALIYQFPIEDEQAELFDRIKRIVLKTVQDWGSKDGTGKSLEEGIDLVIELHRKLLVHAAGKSAATNGTRSGALTLFRELFDTNLALLYRIFTLSRPKAHHLFNVVMETMKTVMRPNEIELESLLNESVGFVENIITFSGEGGEYLKFTKFISMFAGLSREPYASCLYLLDQQLQLQQQPKPTIRDIDQLTNQLKKLHREYVSNPLVVKVAIFLACQGTVYYYRLPQDITLAISGSVIELFQSLMPFVRHCPAETVPELCRKCTSSRRHFAERLLTMLVQQCISQVKDAVERKATGGVPLNPSCTVDRVCELITKKLALLDSLGCERKRLLIDSTIRQSVTWIKYALTTLRDDPKNADDTAEVLKLLKLLITTQNTHKFDFLTDLHLVRLLENCYIERPDSTPAQASVFCWGSVSVRMLKLLLTLREGRTGAEKEEDQSTSTVIPIIRSIMFNQVNAPDGDPIRSLSTVQLYEHPSFDRHGFTFSCVLSREEKFTILAKEMALAVKYKTTLSFTPLDYFIQLQKLGDLRENCLTFGMALYGFSDTDAESIPAETMDKLRASLAAYEPTNIQERVQRSASLAIGSYLSFSLLSRETLSRVRDVPFKIEHFRNDQIDGLLTESQLDREIRLIDQMEAIRAHYGEMLTALVEDNFQSIGVLLSVVQIASILDNVARYCQLNYYPHRAVELQLQNLLLVSQGREERPLEQCAPLGFLLEQHRETEELLDQCATSETACWQKYAGTKLGPLANLAKRAAELLKSFSSPAQQFTDDVPDNRKYQFLNLYLSLAVYYASLGNLAKSLELIRRTLAHLPPTEPSSVFGEGTDGVKLLSPIETIGLLVRGRTAQIIFRLVVEYGLPWPGTTDDTAEAPPAMCTFLKSMLSNFNELQKLPNKHTFVFSLATVEMTVSVLQYSIVRYDTGALVEPYVDQLLKFVLRRGAGLRVMQVLLLYGHMSADMQKLDRGEISLRYLYRVLMLRPIGSSPSRKEFGKKIQEPPVLSDRHDSRHRVPLVSPNGTDNDCDRLRKVVPKHLENSITPAKKWTHLDPSESAEPTIEQYLMFRHATTCDCSYCRYPQYKCMSFQAAALSARLSALQRSPVSTNRAELAYEAIVDHWITAVEPELDRSSETASGWFGAGYRTDVVTSVIRTLVQWGQFLGALHRFGPALNALDRAVRFSERVKQIAPIDPALLEDVNFNRITMAYAQKRHDSQPSLRHKRSRSMIEKNFLQTVVPGRIDGGDPTDGEIVTLSTELNKLLLTPQQQPPSKMSESRGRGPSRTVDGVNELIRQAASRRHQLKKKAQHEPAVPTITPLFSRSYSASARKPKTVNIFVDSPPGPPAGKHRSAVPATVAKMKLSSTAQSASAPNSAISGDDVDVINEHIPHTAPTTERKRRVYGKRALLQDDSLTPTKSKIKSYKEALEAPGKGENNRKQTNVHRFEMNGFPNLGQSTSGSEVSPPKTPQRSKTAGTQAREDVAASPGLNGSFRDVLVLGGAKKTNDSSCVIVLDDSADSHQSEEAVEASFVHHAATMSTGKNSALSLKSYSDRKRLAQAASGSNLTPSTQASTNRRAPFVASKTKLRFDDPSPEHKEDNVPSPDATKPSVVAAESLQSKGFVSVARNTTRKRTCQPTMDDAPETTGPNVSPNKMPASGVDTIATRTRQRRKRI